MSAMRENLTPARIVNSIMQDTTFDGAYMIVEGNEDFLFFSKFVHADKCEVKTAFGWETVIDVLKEVDKRSIKNVVGIIDSDFKRILNVSINDPNIFLTDLHDLVIMAFANKSFPIIIQGYYSKTKFDNEFNGDFDKFRDVLFELIKPLAFLKLTNAINDFGLMFSTSKSSSKPLDFKKIIDMKSLSFNGDDVMIKYILAFTGARCSKKLPSFQDLKKAYDIVTKQYKAVRNDQLCNGHHVSEVVLIALMRKIGSINSKEISVKALERELLLAYDSQEFKQTSLYKELNQWEKSNHQLFDI